PLGRRVEPAKITGRWSGVRRNLPPTEVVVVQVFSILGQLYLLVTPSVDFPFCFRLL
ncbi:hypothetical protein SAMN05444392_108147, partial [Seinonella peptonophila]